MSPDIIVYWMVRRFDGAGSPNKKHMSYISASTEAKRLASENPGHIFTVLQIVSGFVVQQPEPTPIIIRSNIE